MANLQNPQANPIAAPILTNPEINGVVTTTGVTFPSCTIAGIVMSGGFNASAQEIINLYRSSWTSSVDSSVPVDKIMITGFDIAAGHRAFALSCEEVTVNAAAGASDWYLPVRINGATYKLLLHS